MGTVTINAPKTPVTEGSSGIAAATLPNVCKMPGPPAPFVPSPLPNIAKSGDSPRQGDIEGGEEDRDGGSPAEKLRRALEGHWR